MRGGAPRRNFSAFSHLNDNLAGFVCVAPRKLVQLCLAWPQHAHVAGSLARVSIAIDTETKLCEIKYHSTRMRELVYGRHLGTRAFHNCKLRLLERAANLPSSGRADVRSAAAIDRRADRAHLRRFEGVCVAVAQLCPEVRDLDGMPQSVQVCTPRAAPHTVMPSQHHVNFTPLHIACI